MTLAPGARGEAVLDLQARLSALGHPIDPQEHGRFGPSTESSVREFQRKRGLLVDGRVGDETWQQLVEAGYRLGDRVLYLRYPYSRGDDVRALQAALNLLGFDAGREDGILGERTRDAVEELQRNTGLPPDGIVGATTVEALHRVRGVGVGPGRAAVREGEALRRLSATLSGARIAIDAAHGPGDPGVVGSDGMTEAEANHAAALEAARALEARGARPFLVRRADTNPNVSERARAANDAGAEACLSIHLAAHDERRQPGVAAYFYGREGWESRAGHRLAASVVRAVSEELDLPSAVVEARQFAVLRETQMPACHVEPADLADPRAAATLADGTFFERLGSALATGLEAFFAGDPSFSPDASEGDAAGPDA